MKKLFTLALVCILAFTSFAQEPGTLDSSFGTDGMFRFAPSTSHDFIEKVLVQKDGKIVTVGRTRTDGSNYSIYASRHNTDGTLDATFGENGIYYKKVDNLAYINAGFAAALGDNGLLYVAGYTFDGTGNKAYVLCLDENGIEYPLFGEDGVAVSEYGGGIVYEGMDIDSKGRVIVTGYLDDQVLVKRFNTDGQLDPSFGEQGTAIVVLDEHPDALGNGFDIKVVEDDKILVTGLSISEGAIFNTFVCKLRTNGSLDETFGENGIVYLYAGEYAEFGLIISVQADGKYLIGGHDELYSATPEMPRYESYIARVNVDGTIDETFGTEGFVRFEPFSGEGCVNDCYAILAAPDGQIFGTFYSFNFGTQASRAYVYNLDANGQPKEFAGSEDGLMPISLPEDDDVEIRTMAMALQGNKVIIGGYVYCNDGWSSDILLYRVNTDMEEVAMPANIDVVAEAVDANTVKVTATPNEYTTEYHVGIVTKAMYDETGEDALVEAVQADNKPFTAAEEITFTELKAETEYVVIATAKNAADEWVIKTATVTTPEGVGFAELENTNINIYPNPATTKLFVELTSNAQISIVDLTGRCVKEIETSQNITTINIADINKGVYFISIQQDGNRVVEKLVVK